MANTFTSYAAKNVGTSPVTLVTVAAATQTTVIGLTVANTTTGAITADIYFTRSAVNYYVAKGAAIAPGQTFVAVGGDQKLVLTTSDALVVVTNTATSADVIASVLNIT
jgi:hypothetical protein